MKKIITFIMLILLPMAASAYDAYIGGIFYNFSDDYAIVTYGVRYKNNYSGSVTIPSTVTYNGKTYTVTSIGNDAFSYCRSLTSVTIPNSVTSIGEWAFSECTNLTSVTIPNSVTSIGYRVFFNCSSLTSVAIPNTVTSIGGDAFHGCSGLTSVTIPESVTSIGDGAFRNCSGLTSVTIPHSVTSIGRDAFSGCSGLTSVTIPESVTSIGWGAFFGCSGLTSVTIPNSVTSIGDYAFDDCYFTRDAFINNSSLTSDNNWGATLYDGIETSDGLFIENGIVVKCRCWATSITIPESVTGIGREAFCKCSSLTSVTIPNSVTSIGNRAFEDCSNMTSATIGNGVTYIGDYAFSGCSGLTSISLPNSVTYIGGSAFYGCRGLTSITIPESVKVIYYSSFMECSGLKTVRLLGNLVFYDDSHYSGMNISAFCSTATIYVNYYVKMLFYLWRTNHNNIIEIGTGRSLSTPTLTLTPTASSITMTIENFFPQFNNTIVISKTSKVMDEKSITVTGLDPDTQYDNIRLTVSVESTDDFGNPSMLEYISSPYSSGTSVLTLTTQQPKVISAGNVVVAAQSNLDDAETNVGFEWRRTDWTDDFASNTGGGYLYEGTMEGYIRNLYTEKLWKYRPYYESNAGNRYYGDWVGIDPTNTSYFEPTVHTYSTISVTGARAEVKGYAMRGTDKITAQGFMYWKNPSSYSLRKKAASIPPDAVTVLAKGNVMTATLEDLEYETEYCYVAFATTEENETFFGEVQTFSTSFDPDGIKDIEESTLKIEEAWYSLDGKKLSKPQKGINIIRYSDGTSKKVLVK